MLLRRIKKSLRSVTRCLYRRLSLRVLVITVIFLTIVHWVYNVSYASESDPNAMSWKLTLKHWKDRASSFVSYDFCPNLVISKAQIDTMEEFKHFEFQPKWLASREYWDRNLEYRYESQKPYRQFLKVIIVPHSHNDPGWLQTFEQYFYLQTKQIINNVVDKLQQHEHFTFIWSEVVFLDAWWEEATLDRRQALKKLVQSGRLEITTGGWVMTDEATTHVHAMVNQLIEGHQWVLSKFNITPKTGWAVDPFGHGSTQPHLLALAGLEGTVIQRIHYAWKQWLALKQYGDFKWIPAWSPHSSRAIMLTHHQPFDLYTIESSCGPHHNVCRGFDFSDAITNLNREDITDANVKEKSEQLLGQYARTGSMYPHNVVLVPLGNDFTYSNIEEFDQQYVNYMKLIEYINDREYDAEISFGTPLDYFNEIVKRHDQFPTLKGDFFVYSDVSSDDLPAYWSGYFTTRPFMKILGRELESCLRSAEILYTLALNHARQNERLMYFKILERDFEKLVRSRRKLGLFQHHDAITGTSRTLVMEDYCLKLFNAIRNTISLQRIAVQSLVFPNVEPHHNLISSDLERQSYEKLPSKVPIMITQVQDRQIILYNSLSHAQDHLVQVRTSTFSVKVLDNEGKDVIYQINPVWEISEGNSKYLVSSDEYEIIFIARIPQMTLVTYTITYDTNTEDKIAKIYCNLNDKSVVDYEMFQNESSMQESKFKIENMTPGDIQLKNHKFKLLFDDKTGFLKTVYRRRGLKRMKCELKFAAYKSSPGHTGAYMFMTDDDMVVDVLQKYKHPLGIKITSGPVSSEITVIYGAFLVHSVSIYHMENSSVSDGIYIENTVDFEGSSQNNDIEFFMRIVSDVQNGDPPEFYTDQNGFQVHKRIKVKEINIEGNYYPFTTMVFIQDRNVRLSLITNHAQGATSWQTGNLEVMLDRRPMQDDERGLGEGVEDSGKTLHKFWLLIEDRYHDHVKKTNIPRRFRNGTSYPNPSLYANRMSNLLNYPVSIFIVNQEYHENVIKTFHLLNKPLACDVHVLTLRTLPDALYSQFPSPSALLVLHRQGFDCDIGRSLSCDVPKNYKNLAFEHVVVKKLKVKTLSGISSLQERVKELGDIFLEPMSLKTVNVTFA